MKRIYKVTENKGTVLERKSFHHLGIERIGDSDTYQITTGDSITISIQVHSNGLEMLRDMIDEVLSYSEKSNNCNQSEIPTSSNSEIPNSSDVNQ